MSPQHAAALHSVTTVNCALEEHLLTYLLTAVYYVTCRGPWHALIALHNSYFHTMYRIGSASEVTVGSITCQHNAVPLRLSSEHKWQAELLLWPYLEAASKLSALWWRDNTSLPTGGWCHMTCPLCDLCTE